jgi:hypothetical protein
MSHQVGHKIRKVSEFHWYFTKSKGLNSKISLGNNESGFFTWYNLIILLSTHLMEFQLLGSRSDMGIQTTTI